MRVGCSFARSSRKRLHVDVSEDDVVQDVDPVDLVQLSDAVTELEQRDVVHRHSEGLRSAQDLHLREHKATEQPFQPCHLLRSTASKTSQLVLEWDTSLGSAVPSS